MTAAAESPCLVVEQRPRWAPILARRMMAQGVRVVECRTLAECGGWLEERPSAVVAIDAAAFPRLEQALAIARWRRLYPRAAFATLGLSVDAPQAAIFAEAGAALVAGDVHRLDDLAALVERHLARLERPRGLREAIWARLPWQPADGRAPVATKRKKSRPRPQAAPADAAPPDAATASDEPAADEPVEFEPLDEE